MKESADRQQDLESVSRVADAVLANVGRAIVSKEYEVKLCLATLLCNGHLLIEDVPGVGKTLLAKSLAPGFALNAARRWKQAGDPSAVPARANSLTIEAILRGARVPEA